MADSSNIVRLDEVRFGIWLPVYGGWLRVSGQQSGPDVPACLAIAQQAEAMGFDFLYASENLLNCIHGPDEGVADAWSILAAVGATTNKIGLCGAIKPGFRSPFLVARMLDTLSKISRRRLSMNIVCGWWKTEFELSGVSWLDHQRRYDRADAFLRSLYSLFGPPADFTSPERATSEDVKAISAPNYGLDAESMPELWIAGHSDRAIKMAAEWGDCLFLNGMSDADLRSQIQKVQQEANRWGRHVSIAANAYVVAAETTEQAKDRVRAVVANRNLETISFFRSGMDQSKAYAWSQLNEEQMVDSKCRFRTRADWQFRRPAGTHSRIGEHGSRSHRLPVRRSNARRRPFHEKGHPPSQRTLQRIPPEGARLRGKRARDQGSLLRASRT